MCAKCAVEGIKLKEVNVDLPAEEAPKPEIDLDLLHGYIDEFLGIVSSYVKDDEPKA